MLARFLPRPPPCTQSPSEGGAQRPPPSRHAHRLQVPKTRRYRVCLAEDGWSSRTRGHRQALRPPSLNPRRPPVLLGPLLTSWTLQRGKKASKIQAEQVSELGFCGEGGMEPCPGTAAARCGSATELPRWAPGRGEPGMPPGGDSTGELAGGGQGQTLPHHHLRASPTPQPG